MKSPDMMRSALSLISLLLFQGASAQINSGYTFFFEVPGTITEFYSTMVLPAPPRTGSGYHAIWPGLQDANSDVNAYVFQDVADDQFTGAWHFYEGLCGVTGSVEGCAGGGRSAGTFDVYEGDTIDVTWKLNQLTDDAMTNSWTITPGTIGTAAGEVASSGSYTLTNLNQADELAIKATLGLPTQAMFDIELQDGATWSFGQLAFSDITIQAIGGNIALTDSSWCTNPVIQNSTAFEYSMSKPIFSDPGAESGGPATCTISSLIFVQPL